MRCLMEMEKKTSINVITLAVCFAFALSTRAAVTSGLQSQQGRGIQGSGMNRELACGSLSHVPTPSPSLVHHVRACLLRVAT